MSKSKRALFVISSAVIPVILSHSASAGVTLDVWNGGGDIPPTWPNATGTPPSAVDQNDVFDSGSPQNYGGVNETLGPGYAGSAGGKNVEGETFETGATGFKLGEIAYFVAGASNNVGDLDSSIHLFQLNSTVVGSSGGYTLSTAEVIPAGQTAATADLLGGGTGISFTQPGIANDSIEEFVFTGSDQVSLLPNTEYAIELWQNDNADIYLGRLTSQAYTNGQVYSANATGDLAENSTISRNQVSGGGPRNLFFAVYAAPPGVNATWTGNSTVNNSNWNDATNWSGGIPGTTAGDTAYFGTGAGAVTPDLNGSQTLGVVTFNGPAYTVSQGTGGTLFMENKGTLTAQINDSFGNSTLDVPVSLVSNVNVAVGQSTNTLTFAGAITGTGSVTLTGNSSVSMAGVVAFSGANTYSGGTTVTSGELLIKPSGSTSASGLPNGGALTISGGSVVIGTNVTQGSGAATSNVNIASLAISGNGVLDIGNNHIIIDYTGASPMSTIYSYLKTGFNNGGWNGVGPSIVSSAAATEDSIVGAPKYGIGFSDGNDKINGHSVVTGLSSGQIELKYTLVGDANLDGTVNGSDFSILAANFGQGYSNWDQGNFLYTPAVNGTDFSALAANFGQGDSGAASSISQADIAALDAFAAANGLPAPAIDVVPEPASLGLLAIGALGLMNRRRRT